jgi:hypothetical protein
MQQIIYVSFIVNCYYLSKQQHRHHNLYKNAEENQSIELYVKAIWHDGRTII